jgi:hypothetical protein
MDEIIVGADVRQEKQFFFFWWFRVQVSSNLSGLMRALSFLVEWSFSGLGLMSFSGLEFRH